MNELSDAELIRKYLDGCESAFETLYHRYRVQLYSYLNVMLSQRQAEADDVFQQTWVKAIGALAKYKEQGNFRAWIFRIAANLVKDRYRSVTFRPGVMVDIDSGDFAGLPDEKTMLPDEILARADDSGVLAEALAQLPDEQREVFVMRYHELSFKEIAEAQECSQNTALSRMHYAVKNLKKRLWIK